MRLSRPSLRNETRGAATEHAIVLACVALLGAVGLGALGQATDAAIAGDARSHVTTQRGNSSDSHGVMPAGAMATSQEAGIQEAARFVTRGFAETVETVTRRPRPSAPMAEFWLPPATVSVEARAAGIPSRFVVAPGARDMHGPLIDVIGKGLTQGDTLADAVVAGMHGLSKDERNALIERVIETRAVPSDVPDALRAPLTAFLKQVNTVPEWVDVKQLNTGGDVMTRSGAAGLTTLIGYSLPLTYTSPAGVKPLAWTKDLLEATPRRLAETMCFVNQTCAPNALLPGGEAWKATVRVRLIHAHVRAALTHMPKWELDAWGTPINQTEMAGTNAAFSAIFLDGMKRMGFRYSEAESQAVMDLWRYSGYLIGVDDALLARNEVQGRRLTSAIASTQAPPDADSKRLVDALLQVSVVPNPPAQLTSFNKAVTRYLLGDFYSDHLGIGDNVLLDVLRTMGPTSARTWDAFRRRISLVDKASISAGRALWDRVVETTLGKHPAEFLIPENGRGVRSPTTPTNIGL